VDHEYRLTTTVSAHEQLLMGWIVPPYMFFFCSSVSGGMSSILHQFVGRGMGSNDILIHFVGAWWGFKHHCQMNEQHTGMGYEDEAQAQMTRHWGHRYFLFYVPFLFYFLYLTSFLIIYRFYLTKPPHTPNE
jgi:hypothetical protein